MFKELDLLKICCGNVLPLKAKTKITKNTESHILFSRARQEICFLNSNFVNKFYEN